MPSAVKPAVRKPIIFSHLPSCVKPGTTENTGSGKGRASEIIDQIRAKEGDPLASWGQKKRFLELVREGFLRGVKRETFKNLRNAQIKRMIYKGMKNKEAGTFAGPYLHPDDPTPAAA